jgi:hypothetical protein
MRELTYSDDSTEIQLKWGQSWIGSVAEWSKALDLSYLDSQWGKPARVRTSPLPGIFPYFAPHLTRISRMSISRGVRSVCSDQI